MKCISIDIGGTNTRVAFVEDGIILKILKFNTKQNFDNEISYIIKKIKFLKKSFSYITISAPGPANYETGTFGNLPNLPMWEDKNIFKEINKKINTKKILMQNDANLMALANHRYFKNYEGVTQFFTISTGLGAGLIINNKIFKGFSGNAQEVANAPLSFSIEKGKNLSEGALEYFSSGSGLEFRSKINPKKMMSLYKKDKDIKKIIDEGIDTLANAIATSIAFINPNLIIFDGSVARKNPWYVNKAFKVAKKRSSKKAYDVVDMKISEFNDDSAIIGAYYYLIDKVGKC